MKIIDHPEALLSSSTSLFFFPSGELFADSIDLLFSC
jgi:hypothetical protein